MALAQSQVDTMRQQYGITPAPQPTPPVQGMSAPARTSLMFEPQHPIAKGLAQLGRTFSINPQLDNQKASEALVDSVVPQASNIAHGVTTGDWSPYTQQQRDRIPDSHKMAFGTPEEKRAEVAKTTNIAFGTLGGMGKGAPIAEDMGQIAASLRRQIKASTEVFKEYTPEMLQKAGGLPKFLEGMKQNIVLELKAEGHPEASAHVGTFDVNQFPSIEAFSNELQKIAKPTAPTPGLEGGKAGWKEPFDQALVAKDKATIEKLLPYVPDYYKARFEKEINAVTNPSKAQLAQQQQQVADQLRAAGKTLEADDVEGLNLNEYPTGDIFLKKLKDYASTL